ncbi:TPA: hypothetical protein N0F65_008911 [Lagenidium giganteum]|uniref:Protein kinase domain-containing protein n=1 Tax=Lagenidium giganteum TaxID=4803 RepID=A0AAV2YS23_9STRA|nr:TPA: hypothetical protein N0F65_008911 [Lagenidium giganteum]
MQLAHPHITSVVGACHLHKPPFLVREQVRHGDIITYLSNIPDAATRTQRRWELLVQAVQGLQYLHKHDVVHGNLKCSNVLVSRSEQAKLADFGTCFLMQDAVTKSKDEVQWRAPECCSQSSDVTKAADVYALGMCIIEVVTGAKPWGAVSSSVVMSDKQRGALPERPATMSLIAWELVERMCMHDPVQRMGLEEVEQVLQQLATGVGAVVAQDAAADAAAAAAAAPSQPDQATQEDAQPEPEAREEEESHAPRSVYHSTQTGAKGSVPIVHMPSPKKEERETPASPPQEAGKKHEPVEESSEDAEDDEPEQHEQQAEEDGASDTDSDQQDANSGVQALLSRRPGPPSRRNFPLIAERVSHIVSNIWTTRYQSMAVEVASEDVLADNSLIEDAEREEAERKDPTSVPNLLIALMEDNVSQDHALAALSELNRKSEIHSDYESATVEVLLHLIETCMAMREQSLAATVLLRLAASSDTAKELIWEQHGIEVMEECVAMDHDMLSEMKSCIAKGKHAYVLLLTGRFGCLYLT